MQKEPFVVTELPVDVFNGNKKVLLRERKRHTARRVASTHSAVLSRGGGVPHPWQGGTTSPTRRYPSWGTTPILTWLEGYPNLR